MTIEDYAIFGTADGLFAHGAGLLAEAQAAAHLFEFRLPQDAAQFIPGRGAVTLVRRPVAAEETREQFHLFAELTAALDRSGRPGFLGVAVLVPAEDFTLETMSAVAHRLEGLLGQARARFLDESGRFSRQPGALKRAQRDQAPRLTAAGDGPRSQFKAADGCLGSPAVLKGVYALSSLQSEAWQIIQVTTDAGSNDCLLDDDLAETLLHRLDDEIRELEKIRALQPTHEDRAEIVSTTNSLHAGVQQHGGALERTRSGANHAFPTGTTSEEFRGAAGLGRDTSLHRDIGLRGEEYPYDHARNKDDIGLFDGIRNQPTGQVILIAAVGMGGFFVLILAAYLILSLPD